MRADQDRTTNKLRKQPRVYSYLNPTVKEREYAHCGQPLGALTDKPANAVSLIIKATQKLSAFATRPRQ